MGVLGAGTVAYAGAVMLTKHTIDLARLVVAPIAILFMIVGVTTKPTETVNLIPPAVYAYLVLAGFDAINSFGCAFAIEKSHRESTAPTAVTLPRSEIRR